MPALVLTAWRRPGYLAETLASWVSAGAADHFERIVLALGRSEHEQEIAETCARSGLAIDIWPDEAAWTSVPGEHAALGHAIDRVFTEDPDLMFTVVSSEDVVVSSDVIPYFRCCRTMAPPGTVVINAHNALGQGWHPWWDDSEAEQDVVRVGTEFSPWCWGTWRASWRDVLRPRWDWDCTSGQGNERGWDWQISRVVRGYKTLTPDASRARSIGREGGVYSHPGMFLSTQPASFRAIRRNVSYRLAW